MRGHGSTHGVTHDGDGRARVALQELVDAGFNPRLEGLVALQEASVDLAAITTE